VSNYRLNSRISLTFAIAQLKCLIALISSVIVC